LGWLGVDVIKNAILKLIRPVLLHVFCETRIDARQNYDAIGAPNVEFQVNATQTLKSPYIIRQKVLESLLVD
jgi:hypothetical protein